MQKMTVPHMALWVALIALGAFIKIPVPVVPFTLQLPFVLLAGAMMGPRKGMGCVLVYIVLGLVGVPLFAEGGGPAYLFKPTFGYLIGFAFGALVVGFLLRRPKLTYRRCLVAHLTGLGVVYLFGVVWLWAHAAIMTGVLPALRPILFYGLAVAVPGDLALCFLTAEVNRRLKVIDEGKNGSDHC